MYQVEIPTRLKYYDSSYWYGNEIITWLVFLVEIPTRLGQVVVCLVVSPTCLGPFFLGGCFLSSQAGDELSFDLVGIFCVPYDWLLGRRTPFF